MGQGVARLQCHPLPAPASPHALTPLPSPPPHSPPHGSLASCSLRNRGQANPDPYPTPLTAPWQLGVLLPQRRGQAQLERKREQEGLGRKHGKQRDARGVDDLIFKLCVCVGGGEWAGA